MTQTSSSMTKPAVHPPINSTGAVFRDTVSRCRTPFILYIIAMAVFGPLAALIDYASTDFTYRTEWGGSELIILCYLIFLGASAVIPMVVFSYLDNRRALDVFHALPVTRGKLFWGNVLACLFLLFVPYVACVLPVAALTDLSPLWLGGKMADIGFDMLRVTAICAAAAVLMLALMALLVISCSTLVESFGYFCILMVGYYVAVELAFDVVGQYTFGYDGFWLRDFLTRFSPLSALFGALNLTSSGPYIWYYILQMGGLGALLLLVAWRRLLHRRSEQAGGYIWAPVYYLAAGTGAVTAGLYIRTILGSGDDGVDLLAAVVTALLVYIVLDTIRNRGFKRILRSAVTGAAGVAGAAALALVIAATGTFGYESWVPDTDDILSVAVDAEDPAALSSAFPLSDSESIRTVVGFHQSVVGNREPLESGDAETLVQYDPFGFADSSRLDGGYGDYMRVEIRYTLKSGRTESRSYAVPTAMLKPLYQLSGSVRYSASIADQLDAYAADMQASDTTADSPAGYYWGNSRGENNEYYFDLTLEQPGPLRQTGSSAVGISFRREEAVDFLTGLAADLRARPEKAALDAENQPFALFDLGSIGLSNYGENLCLYPSDRNTAELLNRLGYYTEADGLITYGDYGLDGVTLAVLPKELDAEIRSLAFHFSGLYAGIYDDRTAPASAETQDAEISSAEPAAEPRQLSTLFFLPAGVEETIDDYAALTDGDFIQVNAVSGSWDIETIRQLQSLTLSEGYSDEPMDLLYIGGNCYFIPGENVEKVSEIIYG